MGIKIVIGFLFIVSLFLIPRVIASNQPANEAKNSDLIKGKLKPCPHKPNCINTEYPEDISHYIAPIDFSDSQKTQIMPLAKKIILAMGGTIVREEKQDNRIYTAALFTSWLFRFVDDFELRQDNITHKLYIRSASRSGYSDFGINKRRTKQFSEEFRKQLNSVN